MKKYNKSSLFLMELIIAILFFSIASAVCLQVFFKAHTMNEDNIHKSEASLISSQIAEVYRSHQLDKYYPVDSEGYVYFDSQGNKNNSSYVYKVKLTEENYTLTITVFYQDQNIYTLECMKYQQIRM